MLKDRVVCIKLKKYYKEQKPLNYVGKVTAFTDVYLVADARCVMLARQQQGGVQIDKVSRAMLIPMDSIETIRVLPNNFDCENIRATTDGQQMQMIVDGKRDCLIGEMGDG